MKVAVFAGTKGDTREGVKILNKFDISTIEYPFSNTPEEQTRMQYFSREELNKMFEKNVQEAKTLGAEKIFVYCNSLSLSVDYQEIGEREKIEIITPLETYKNLKGVKNLAIIAANGFSAYSLDRLVAENNVINSSVCIGNMPFVEKIEAEDRDVLNVLNIQGFLNYIEGITGEYKIDTLLIGCTHFSKLSNEIKSMTKLNVVDPTENMIKELMS